MNQKDDKTAEFDHWVVVNFLRNKTEKVTTMRQYANCVV